MNWFDFSVVAVEFALNWLLQSSLLIIFGLAAAAIFRKRGAAVQSAIFRTALAAVLVCPLATLCLYQAGVPGWSVRLPSSWQSIELADKQTVMESPIAIEELTYVDSSQSKRPDESEPVVVDPAFSYPPSPDQQSQVTEPALNAEVAITNSDLNFPVNETPDEAVEKAGGFGLASRLIIGIVAVWFAIAMVMLIRLLSAWRKMAQLRSSAIEANETTLRACRELAETLQVQQPKVLQSPYLPGPCLTGLFKPAVMLPEGDDDISIREVLVHELAHLRRRDCHWNLLRQLATSLFFFQPLLWCLSRQIETSAEEVCDDFVVSYCTDRRGYAEQLVSLAESNLVAPSVAGLGMFGSKTMLGHRVTRILDTTRSLTTQISRPAFSGIALVAVSVLMLSGLIGGSGSFSQLSGEVVADDPVSEPKLLPLRKNENSAAHDSAGIPVEHAPMIEVTGKIIDTEGNPVADAEIEVYRLLKYSDQFDLFQHIQKIELASKPSQIPSGYKAKLVSDLKVKTDSNGNFTFKPLAKNQIALLEVSGKNFAHQKSAVAITRHTDIKKVQDPRGSHAGGPMRVLGSKPTIVLEHSLPIIGVIVDEETGKPISGLKVNSYIVAGPDPRMSLINQHVTSASTDANGRFQLEGMPTRSGNQIIVSTDPKSDIQTPYLSKIVEVPLAQGNDPVELNIELKSTHWIRGKVVNRESEKPVVGVRVQYQPARDNEQFVQANPRPQAASYSEVESGPQGEFKIVGMPGLGFVTTIVHREPGYPKHQGLKDIDEQYQQFLQHPFTTSIKSVQMKDKDVELDMELTKGLAVAIKTVDQQNQPVNGVRATVIPSFSSIDERKFDQSDFQLFGFEPDRPRTVFFESTDRQLGCVKTIRLSDSPMTVVLQKKAKLKINAVDGKGKPASGITFNFEYLGDNNRTLQRTGSHCALDKNGLINQDLVPGKYAVSFQSQDGFSGYKKVELRSGQVFDLGELDVSKKFFVHTMSSPGAINPLDQVPFEKLKTVPSPEEKKPVEKEAVLTSTKNSDTLAAESLRKTVISAKEINGRVVDVNKKPIAGAQLLWFNTSDDLFMPARPRLIATSDTEGRFKLDHSSFNATTDDGKLYAENYQTVVRASGYGVLKHADLRAQSAHDDEITLVLQPAGRPLRGRIVDVDGKGVAGASVRIRHSYQANHHLPHSERAVNYESLDSDQLDEHFGRLLEIIPYHQMIYAMPHAVTDTSGRFEITDVKSDSLFHLVVQGENIETENIFARNQPGKKLTTTSELYDGRKYELHANDILHVAGPSKPIEGQVVDAESGETISEALVIAGSIGPKNTAVEGIRKLLTTKTDAQGKFRMTGLPPTKGVEFICWCRGHEEPYPLAGLHVDTTQPGEILDVKFPVKRGVWLEGRVFDADSKKPLHGAVNAFYFRNPELERQVRLHGSFIQGTHRTDPNGNYRIPVQATRGILTFRLFGSEEFSRYPRGAGAALIEGMEDRLKCFPTLPIYLLPNNYSRLLEFHPDGSQETIKVDVPLSSGPRIVVKPTWPDGVEVKKYQVYGRTSSWRWEKADSPSFEVEALESGEERNVFVFSHEHDLVGAVTVSAPEEPTKQHKKPLEVRMERAGQIVGRLVDSDGEPITDARMWWSQKPREQPGWGVWAPDPNKNRNTNSINTDDEGRFRITGIVPGWRYTASASADRKWHTDMMSSTHIGIPFDNVKVKPGEAKDLGDLVTQPKTSN